MRVSADTARCIGAGQCVLTAPEIFGRGEDAHVTLVTDSPDEGQLGHVMHAIVRCPSGAITLTEK